MTIGERIKSVRKFMMYTQKALADKCGIAEPTIRKYESGRLNPKQETLEKLAAALECSVEYLRYGTGPKPQVIRVNAGERIRYLKEYKLFSAIDESLLVQYFFFVLDEDGKPMPCNAADEIKQAESLNEIVLNAKIPNLEKDRLRVDFCNALFNGKCTPYIPVLSDRPSYEDFERLLGLCKILMEGSTITMEDYDASSATQNEHDCQT